ncbi:MAG TPA: hypothetical protein PLD20_24425 [Blastocatellia bacterium]|nr:hypothetical protein [Blastocatellia bacterium]HMV87936.1 hypothetical protein [Blastocatellia bacterium]HMX27518.1 hypothetical protein [Blastocatellia bacterium]HMY73438.1 hypothetical protein [Blastocatellia bacterium]HMZ21102.1 hypothetical protein [Blastocatellia bacterium]
MANPRAIQDFTDIRSHRETFTIDGVTITFDKTKPFGSDQAGKSLAVTLSGNGTVALAADGDRVIGTLELVEKGDKCTVQTGAYCKFKGGTSASLTLGKAIVGALRSSAKGYIREVATGTAAELGKCGGFIVDAADTDAIVVNLE